LLLADHYSPGDSTDVVTDCSVHASSLLYSSHYWASHSL